MKKIICIVAVLLIISAVGIAYYNNFINENNTEENQINETSLVITEIPLESIKGISGEEAVNLCFSALGKKDEKTGFPFSFGVSGAVERGRKQYYVIRGSWLVNNSHLSYIGDFFVSADGTVIYSGTALQGEYTMEKIIWEK